MREWLAHRRDVAPGWLYGRFLEQYTGVQHDCMACLQNKECAHAGNHVCCHSLIRERLLSSGHAVVDSKGKIVLKTLYQLTHRNTRTNDENVAYQANVEDIIKRTFKCQHCVAEFRAAENEHEEMECPVCFGIFSYRDRRLCTRGCTTPCIIMIDASGSLHTSPHPRRKRRRRKCKSISPSLPSSDGISKSCSIEILSETSSSGDNFSLTVQLGTLRSTKDMYQRVRNSRLLSSYEDEKWLSLSHTDIDDDTREVEEIIIVM